MYILDNKIHSISQLVTEIQSFGLRVPSSIQGRNGGAGPAEGITLHIQDFSVNVPIKGTYIRSSPYHLQENGSYLILCHENHKLINVSLVSNPSFYQHYTSDGFPYSSIALRHSNNCLASTIIQHCAFWRTSMQCAFCGIGISLENNKTLPKKTPNQLAEVARTAQEANEVSHVVLTSGSAHPPGPEITHLADCSQAIKEATGLPIHIQCLPPSDLSLLDDLKKNGVDTLGLHIETFDSEILRTIAPAKADIGLDQYLSALKTAVDIFGPGQVSSFLITGLGETPESVVQGSERLADLGVYPFVVPFRPISRANLDHLTPPNPSIMSDIYTSVARILRQKGLHSSQSLAGCVRCGACSALKTYELVPQSVICHTARTNDEFKKAMYIRKSVFVHEQGLFKENDCDEHDAICTLLVAKRYGEVVGTVRIFPEGNKHWMGGRLAVKKGHRDYQIGSLLVKEAMKRVKVEGCTCFKAYIQEKNVDYFQSLGWKPINRINDHCGEPHQLMQADLSLVSLNI